MSGWLSLRHMTDNLPLIAVSSLNDGSMSAGVSDQNKLRNRTTFLRQYGIKPEQAILVHLRYEGNDYKRYFTVTADFAGDGIVSTPSITADALFTTDKNVALLLPVADCIAAVLYDPVCGALGLAHLGRHNLVQTGGAYIVSYMVEAFGSAASNIQVYLGPAAGRERYPLYDFNNRSLHEVAAEQLLSAGILQQNILRDTRDTTNDPTLFSHSEFLKGNRASDGRQAVAAMMLP